MKLPKLTPRLKLIASLVPHGATVADIGTDHAYIPVFLINSGVCHCAIAADILDGPLKSAVDTIQLYNSADKVKVVKSDGFLSLPAGEFDTAIIAGMGGTLISKILEDGKIVAKSVKHLILQPMTAVYELRKYLYENGFEITEEHLIKEGDKLYNVIVAAPSVDNKPVEKIDEVIHFHVGKHLAKHRPQLFAEYIERLMAKFETKLAGLHLGTAEELDSAISMAEQILEKLEELL